MFPFELNTSILHAAIGAKCTLSELVLDFRLTDDTDKYM